MLPTLSPGEQLFYEPREGLSAFSPGEILVLRDPRHASRQLVKRLDHLSTEGQLWLLGDCPDRSTDSRHWGYLSPQHVLGRVRYRLGAPLFDQDRS